MYDSLQGLVPSALLTAYYIGVAFLIFSILLDNRNPSKTLGYVLVLIFLPVLGVLFYLYFGRDVKKRKLFSRKGLIDSSLLQEWKKDKAVVFEKSLSSEFVDIQHKIVSKLLQNNNAYLSVNNYVKDLQYEIIDGLNIKTVFPFVFFLKKLIEQNNFIVKKN